MPSMDSALASCIDQIRAAAAQRTPLRICGGGTKDFHGLARHGEVLSTRALSGVLSYEPSELVVTARAGTPLVELEALLAERGQCLPFEPPHCGPSATVGGMVSAGWSGPARASVGAVRDYVLGVGMVNGRAEPLQFGGQVMKNVAGYDVSRLVTGAWGTLGLLTEVSLKVLPVAPAEATLRFEYDQATALARLQAWGAQPLPLNASRWVPEAGTPGLLYLRLRGAAAAVDAACQGLGGERLGPQACADWTACREQTLPWFAQRPAGHALWRLSVPQSAPVLSLPETIGPPLIEWHGGLRWVQAPLAAGEALGSRARAAGGHAQLFRGPADTGPVASPWSAALSPALDALHARLKHAFDPEGIFNPGRVASAW